MDYKTTVENWKQLNLGLKDLFAALNRDGILLSNLSKEELKDFIKSVVEHYEPHQRRMVQHYIGYYENVLQTSIEVPEEDLPDEPVLQTVDEQAEADEYRKNAKYVEDTDFLESLGEFEGEVKE